MLMNIKSQETVDNTKKHQSLHTKGSCTIQQVEYTQYRVRSTKQYTPDWYS